MSAVYSKQAGTPANRLAPSQLGGWLNLASNPAAFDKKLAAKMDAIAAAAKPEAPVEVKHESIWKQVVIKDDGTCGRVVKKAVTHEIDMNNPQQLFSRNITITTETTNKQPIVTTWEQSTIKAKEEEGSWETAAELEKMAAELAERNIEKAQAQADGWLAVEVIDETRKASSTGVAAPASDSMSTSALSTGSCADLERSIEKAQAEAGGWLAAKVIDKMRKEFALAHASAEVVTAPASSNVSAVVKVTEPDLAMDITTPFQSMTVSPAEKTIIVTKSDKLSKWAKISFTKATATDDELVADISTTPKNTVGAMTDKNTTYRNQYFKPESKAAPQEGAVVGGSADAIGTESKGHALLSKMGYTPGTGLGRMRTGRLEPVVEIARFSKRGLGADEVELDGGKWEGYELDVDSTECGSWEPAKVATDVTGVESSKSGSWEPAVPVKETVFETVTDSGEWDPTPVIAIVPGSEDFDLCGPSEEELAHRKAEYIRLTKEHKAQKNRLRKQQWKAKNTAQSTAHSEANTQRPVRLAQNGHCYASNGNFIR